MFRKNQSPTARNRQWGAERSTTPLPIQHAKPSTLKITLSRVAIVASVSLWALYVLDTIIRQFFDEPQTFRFLLESIAYLIIVTFLTFSALLYLMMRQGALQRFARHVRVPRAKLEQHFSKHESSITVLVPSYAEEVEVVRKTMLSAALQEYPKIKVLLLIDDKPHPTNSEDLERLQATRKLADDITQLLKAPQLRFQRALKNFEKHHASGKTAKWTTVSQLSAHYAWAADWLREQAKQEHIEDHVDEFFVDQVLLTLAEELSLTSAALAAAFNEGTRLSVSRVHQLYRRLSWTFGAELDFFERKRYASLSHEANKAMNLNSYIGLMGSNYTIRETTDGPILIPVTGRTKADIKIPDSEYLLTLDADSILLREYCLRLTYLLQEPGNERVAVTQTPYSSFRGAATRIERLAAATTDVQHILHQGMTYYDATFWVGANAIIRKEALEDIVEKEYVGGFEIKRYIQDRTVIEDTESSVDIKLHGWSLVNYPERLSYSATPPDFGSLIIQRRRWANGGLLIMPKLFKLMKKRKQQGNPISRAEFALRMNYMASIAWANFGLVLLLAYPYDGRLLSPFVVLAAVPYFLAMASDLKYCGYKRSDILRIYGFNLILLLVNLAGVTKSIQQALTSKKIPFARTPKVKGRTVASVVYVLAPLLIIIFSVITMYRDIRAENWGNATFAGINATLTLYATIAYIGIRNTFKDIWVGLVNWLYVDATPKQRVRTQTPPSLDWRAVLYHGHDKEAVPLGVDEQELA